MLDEIKLLLGDSASNYSDAQIEICLKHSVAEIKCYCNRELDFDMELAAERLTVIKLNRLGTEGVTAESFSGVSNTYLEGWPQDIIDALNRKRKIKTI